MNDLGYWLSILVWPIGVAVVVIAIEVESRVSAARARRVAHDHKVAGTPAE